MPKIMMDRYGLAVQAIGLLILLLAAERGHVVFAGDKSVLPSPASTAEVAADVLTDGKPGCVSQGKWYPEGARIAPDIRRRLIVRGEFVCTQGKWAFVRN